MSAALKAIWVPASLSLTVSMTFFSAEIEFDTVLFLLCLVAITGHFYTTHYFGAKFFSRHYPGKAEYWRIVSISYIPFILSFWVGILCYEHTVYYADLFAYITAGLLITIILFAVLMIAKVRHDLDVILGMTAIIAIAGAISLTIYSMALAQFFDWLT